MSERMIRIGFRNYVNARHVACVWRDRETLRVQLGGCVDAEESVYLQKESVAEEALQVVLRCLRGEDASMDIDYGGELGANQWLGRRSPLVHDPLAVRA